MIALVPGFAGVLLAACKVISVGDLQNPSANACPVVTRVVSAQAPSPLYEPSEPFDILVLSDGFLEDQLDEFRCATRLIVADLLEKEPFKKHQCAINVDRMDIASSESGIPPAAACAEACTAVDPDWPDRITQCAVALGAPPAPSGLARIDTAAWTDPPPSCVQFDLGTELCVGGHWCRAAFPTGTGATALPLLAACAGEYDAVLVLTRSGVYAGNGTLPEDVPPHVAVATLYGIGVPGDRANLVAHELGHALGLYDEYDMQGEGLPLADERNVTAHTDTAGVPWASLCSDANGTLSATCAVACNTACGCDPYGAPPDPTIGLWPGAQYSACGFYRGTKNCRMRDEDKDMCPVCQWWVDSFSALGAAKCGPNLSSVGSTLQLSIFEYTPVAPPRIIGTSPLGPPKAIALDSHVIIENFFAQVGLAGVSGRIDIDIVKIPVAEGPSGATRIVSLQRVPRELSTFGIELRLDDRVVESFSMAFDDEGRFKLENLVPHAVPRGPMTVIDRVEHRTWISKLVMLRLKVLSERVQ